VNIQVIGEQISQFVTSYGLNLLGAILIFVVGRWVSRRISLLIEKLLSKSRIEKTLVRFIRNISYYGLFIFFTIAALSKLGIQTASFIAVLGAAGLAVGFALQGSLSNFASGVLLILFHPFKIGDHVEAGGANGIVEEIQIFRTVIISFDNKRIFVPNSKIMSDKITNHTAEDIRRVDLLLGIGYDDDIRKAREILLDIFQHDDRILKDPAPKVIVKELGDSSVNLSARPYVNTEDYWGVYFDMLETVKLRFDDAGINIPYPQRDIHMISEAD